MIYFEINCARKCFFFYVETIPFEHITSLCVHILVHVHNNAHNTTHPYQQPALSPAGANAAPLATAIPQHLYSIYDIICYIKTRNNNSLVILCVYLLSVFTNTQRAQAHS